MANVLPEVRPAVESMPHEGFVMQTGGSARRSTIKNNGLDSYFVTGVPGHTHNASAMISVTADYSRTRTVAAAIDPSWAEEKVDLGVGAYQDSVEPDDAEELYDRAIERGIGTITLVPENCQHNIKEPVRSISEVRTIVSAKDRRDTMTYVDNEFGWVDPVTGELTSVTVFNRMEPVMVNFYGYPAPWGDTVSQNIVHVQVANSPTIRQPVYIGSRQNLTYRYAIQSLGSDLPAGPADWDGNVPFMWDEASRTYRSEAFTKYFAVARIQTRQASAAQGQIGTGPQQNQMYQVLSTNHIAVGGNAGLHIGDIIIGNGTIHVHGDSVALLDKLAITTLHPALAVIPQAQFKVMFPAYSTQPAKDGFCVLSRVPSDIVFSPDIKYDAMHAANGIGFHIVPDLPVDIEYSNNKITDQPYWFGPPAYRIKVGGKYAMPGPIRDQRVGQGGEGFPGQDNDFQLDYFDQMRQHSGSSIVRRTFEYQRQFMRLIDLSTANVPGQQPPFLQSTLALTPRTMDMAPGNALAINILHQELISLNASAVAGNQFILPINQLDINAQLWGEVISNFNSAPYFFIGYNQNRVRDANEVQLALPDAHTNFRRALMTESRIGVSGMDEEFKYGQSPYAYKNMYLPSSPLPDGYSGPTPRFTCDGCVNRPYLRTPSYQDPGGVPDTIQIAQNYYNQLVACPLHTYIITALIAAHWSVNNAPGAPVQPPGQPAPAAFPDFFPPNYNMVSAQGVPALTAAERSAFLGFTTAKTVVNNELALTITLPRPANPTFLRAVQAVQLTHPQFDDDYHNVALDMYRRHFNNWIWRSLHTFKKDDAFLDPFDYAATAAENYLSAPFRPDGELGMEPQLKGGYRLYSAQVQVQWNAPLVVVDPALAGPQNAPPQILTEDLVADGPYRNGHFQPSSSRSEIPIRRKGSDSPTTTRRRGGSSRVCGYRTVHRCRSLRDIRPPYSPSRPQLLRVYGDSTGGVSERRATQPRHPTTITCDWAANITSTGLYTRSGRGDG